MSCDKTMRFHDLRLKRQRGQTLFIALVVLFILLVLGLVFTGIVSRNINQTATAVGRTASNDLAESGIRYAHSQLLNSALGADWRGEPIDIATNGDATIDPDMLYLRPGTGIPLRDDADTVLDLGGPDGLGPFTRVQFQRGRALVRVRYSPTDASIFQAQTVGTFSNPGAARNYLIIESVGRLGRVNLNDPTTLSSITPIQFRNFPNNAAFRTALGEMRNADAKQVNSRRLVGFATIGIIESARFITNKDKVSRPAEIGVSNILGVQYEGAAVNPPLVLGSLTNIPRLTTPALPQANVAVGGSLFSNADLQVHGTVQTFLNASLGDSWLVNGTVRGADANGGGGGVSLNYSRWNTGLGSYDAFGPINLSNATNPSLNSRSNQFSTATGLLRDGLEGTDQGGYWRGTPRKDPPLMSWSDPQTGTNRYLALTRESGALLVNGNAGRFGHGDGVYVGNTQDRQLALDENVREAAGSENSLVNDWFNPGNKAGWRLSGWKGQYYIPRGSFLQLLPDGFQITRDNQADNRERTWRRPDGSDTGSSVIRYRIGQVGGRTFIVNSFTPGVNINAPAAGVNFALGREFNGVLYFEGNVRVRGIIPTDVPLTVVSGATIYVEGSITKGVLDANGARLNRPSRSSLMLMARDYVAVNTTMFFGPTSDQNITPKSGVDAVMLTQGGRLDLQADLLLDPQGQGANPNNPSTWAPFAVGGANPYQSFSNPGSTSGPDLESRFVVSHASDDGAASYSMVAMDVNYGIGNPTYLFPLARPNSIIGVNPYLPGYTTPGYTISDYVPIYALGAESWQRFPKFETSGFSLLTPGSANYAFPAINSTAGQGLFTMLAQDTNVISIRPQTLATLGSANDYLLSRAAITPHDIRIEAAMYAERGSFVVIPGYWFNTNPNDTRAAFENNIQQYVANGSTQADAVRSAWDDRQRDYGSGPDAPFYAEPMNVRVEIIGAVSENMPLPMSYQAEWMKKWGWMPRQIGAQYRITGSNVERVLIPWRHVPAGYDIRDGGPDRYVPNFSLSYDPMLATGRVAGFVDSPDNLYVRRDAFGRPLPPMPRLPVSPTLSYFGEVLN